MTIGTFIKLFSCKKYQVNEVLISIAFRATVRISLIYRLFRIATDSTMMAWKRQKKRKVIFMKNNTNSGNKPILSIIIPVYNSGKYLSACIDSCINQNVEKDKFEIICVNDGSIDECDDILNRYCNYPNFTVLNKVNEGVSSAKNMGIKYSNGSYLWFVDSDDFIQKNILKDIISILTEYKYDRLMVLPYKFNDGDSFVPEKVTNEMSQKEYKNFMWTMLIKSNCIKENKFFFEKDVCFAEDYLFMVQLTPYIKNTFNFEKIGYFYRVRTGSLTFSLQEKKRFYSRMRIATVCKEIMDKKRKGSYSEAKYLMYRSMSDVMSHIAGLDGTDRKLLLKKVKTLELYPLKKDKALINPLYKKNMKYLYKINEYFHNISYTRIGYAFCIMINILVHHRNLWDERTEGTDR